MVVRPAVQGGIGPARTTRRPPWRRSAPDSVRGWLAPLFNERNEAVRIMIRNLIRDAHLSGTKVGICGQAPSDYPDFAAFLVDIGIDSISLNPDSVIKVKRRVAEQESERQPFIDELPLAYPS